jgi:hypothetical protein
VLSVVAGLAYVKAYTGQLTIAEIGIFFYLSTLSYSLNALVFLPVDFYMQARIAQLEFVPAKAIGRLIAATLVTGLGACILVSAPFVYFDKLQLEDLPWIYAVAVMLYLCTSFRNLLNIRGSSVFVSVMLVLESAGRLFAFLAMALLLGRSARTLMVSSALALALELAVILWQCRRRLAFSGTPEQLDSPAVIVRTSASLAGGAVSNMLQLQTYRVMYPLAGLAAASGVYGIVSNVGAAAMSACASIYSQIESPRLYQSQGASIGSFVKLAVALSLGVLAVALLFSSFLVGHLTQKQYVPYALAIGFGVVVEACNLIIGGYGIYLTLYKRTAPLFHLHLLGAVVSVLGCLAAFHWSPQSPMLIGFALAGSQLLITPLMGLFVLRHRTGRH